MSRLAERLAAGKFVVTAEVTTPVGADSAPLRRRLELYRGLVDAVNVTDNPSARVHMASWAGAIAVREANCEPVLQLTCRDRNRLALQSDVLGVAAFGVENVLCLTGDHPVRGDHPQALPVYDLDSLQELAMLRRLRDEGRLAGGGKVEPPPRLFLGAVENPFAAPQELRAWRLEKKVRAGAQFIQTQVVYDVAGLARFLEAVRRRDLQVPILAGVCPPKSARMLRYLAEKVPGIVVPPALLERMEKAADPRAEGIAVGAQIIRAVRQLEGVRGVHLSIVGWEEELPRVLEAAGLR
ncbi:MAG: methylenetetrahydrofolate reductase [Thermaerobacter sp.]|nr:methylenetetrahydrofolate reductase [Thermaerobacter sp.]